MSRFFVKMSKSTPLTELRTTSIDAVDPKPLVSDILKEIEHEQHGTPDRRIVDSSDPQHYAVQQDQAMQYQVDANVQQPPQQQQLQQQQQQLQQQQLQQQQQQQQQKQQLLQQDHQLQDQQAPEFQQGEPVSLSTEGQAVDMDGIGSFQEIPFDTTPSKSLGQRIFEQAKDPLLVILLSILLSVPAVSTALYSLLSKLPGGSSSMMPIVIRALLAGILFFSIRKVL